MYRFPDGIIRVQGSVGKHELFFHVLPFVSLRFGDIGIALPIRHRSTIYDFI